VDGAQPEREDFGRMLAMLKANPSLGVAAGTSVQPPSGTPTG
jgi:hypothetical protein